MRTLYLLRHSLTGANARRLYCGATDLTLSAEGRALAAERRGSLPDCARYVSSGMRRADETLRLLTGREPDIILDGLREMDFGAFEMRSYEDLKALPAYQRWILDKTGDVACPGGESRAAFQRRVLAAGERLLNLKEETALAVCHGGTVAALMAAWFPGEPRHFYQWQPGPCGGYRIYVAGGRPLSFEEA